MNDSRYSQRTNHEMAVLLFYFFVCCNNCYKTINCKIKKFIKFDKRLTLPKNFINCVEVFVMMNCGQNMLAYFVARFE